MGPFANVSTTTSSPGLAVIRPAPDTMGYVTALRRAAVSPFEESQMVTMETLEQAAEEGVAALDRYLMPMDEALRDCPAVELGPSESYYLLRGNPVAVGGRRPAAGTVRIYGPGTEFLGIGELLPEGMVAPRRLVARPPGSATQPA